ncbi:SsrA-binding protein SmpB [Patescibacteria group bacterium]|nr:SsrA-binding protein SmpB [Patescibacteria group bacterium]
MKTIIARNKKARHDYTILDTLVAGIALLGHEVKSIREGKISIKEAHARIINNEAFLLNANITKYKQHTDANYDPIRTRKLLLNRREINKLLGKLKEKGLALAPLSIFIQNNKLVKVELGIGKGKKQYDKREKIKKKDLDRKMKRRFGKV